MKHTLGAVTGLVVMFSAAFMIWSYSSGGYSLGSMDKVKGAVETVEVNTWGEKPKKVLAMPIYIGESSGEDNIYEIEKEI